MSCLNKNNNVTFAGNSKISQKISFNHSLAARLSSKAKIKLNDSINRNTRAFISSNSKLIANENIDFGLNRLSKSDNSNIRAYSNINFTVYSRLLSKIKLNNNFVDKFAGYKPNFAPYEKLYPVQDIHFKSLNGNNDIALKVKNNSDIIIIGGLFPPLDNVYSTIDDGVFINDYTSNNGNGLRISDDSSSFVITWEVFSSGDVQYKFKVNKPLSVAKNSYFALRAYLPIDSYSLKRPQEYKFYDIKLEDPSGNLIIEYEDISAKGDSNFTTYISGPKNNLLLSPTWNFSYPLMDDSGSYSLRFNIGYNCSSYPFTSNFGAGYEQTCIINKNELDPNPFKSLQISAVEIGNSGGVGILRDSYIPLYSQVKAKSDRLNRILLPSQLLTYDFDNGIYPQSNSVWKTITNDTEFTNTSNAGSYHLVEKIKNTTLSEYITLSNTLPVSNSGRLILKFDTTPNVESYYKYDKGGFAFGGSNSFNDAKLTNSQFHDPFFNVDTLELRVIAKKATGSPDYTIDVVGYSNDNFLNITSAINGFIQNSGALDFNSNSVPDTSGYIKINRGLSDSSLSDQSEYFEKDISTKGDHYIINNSPLINSTSFAEYVIPLQIYQNPGQLGYKDYSNSSMFESLYLDISPLPSGASICSIQLVAYHKPSNAIMLHTLGSPQSKRGIRKNINLLPSSNGTINTSPRLSGVLTGFSSPSYLKTNYARRWRGNVGNVLARNSFDFSEFDFSFDHEQSNTPFLTSYIDFTKIDGVDIQDHKNNYFAQAAYINLLSNFGWRYSSDQLINGITTPYKSISWANNIYDSFDRALRIDSSAEMESPILNISNSFAFFIRYTPDKVDNLDLENHLILSHENSSDWAMVLVVENGYLTLKIKDSLNDVYRISDNKQISEYSFPLSILITHDSGNYNTFRLYTDDDSSRLRGSIFYHAPKVLSNPITLFDYSTKYSDQLPIPMFLHEIGLSNNCNIVPVNANKSLNQITADNFFDSYNVLANNIDDDISQWHLGNFKVCQFSAAFDFYTKREGQDYLTFTLNHDGSGYSQTTNKQLPSNVNLSGVAYHTQIEHDFLRFELANIPYADSGRFYAAAPRIVKTLPKGYQLKEEAICVDTIVEHDTYSDIRWPNGKLGPKLIVSLYSPTLDSFDRPSKRFGLVNRSTHYLEPSGCIRKLTSKFTLDNLIDTQEPWAEFDKEIYAKEFAERYFVKDLDSMFLQYDLVYPSGKPIQSLIKIHNANVRLDDTLYFSESGNTSLNLFSSGQQCQYAFLNMFVPENGPSSYSGINLYISGVAPLVYSLNLHSFSSGYYVNPGVLNLHTVNYTSLDSSQNFGSLFGSSPIKGLNLYTSGQFVEADKLSLYTSGPLVNYSSLPLYISSSMYSSSGVFTLYSMGPENNAGTLITNVNLNTVGRRASYNAYPSSNMSLFVDGATYKTDLNNFTPLFIAGYIPNLFSESGSLPLFTINYPISESLMNASASINWRNDNVGQSITTLDNIYAYVDADDNIRGVDLVCYGNCDSQNRCSEDIVNIHGVKWYYPEICVDGGIFRPKNTYTNLSFPSGSFKHTTGSGNSAIYTENGYAITSENNSSLILEQSTPEVIYDPMPYSGHFYGIRKYTGLAPNLPYLVNITGRTGSIAPIDIPTEIIEVEYNKNETDLIYADYDGFRIIPSGSYKISGNEFGKSIATKEDLLVIGSPKQPIQHSYKNIYGNTVNETLVDAGIVFIYRRNARPSGSYWPLDNYKSSWIFEKALTVPSGLLKDYSIQTEISYGLPYNPIQTKWYVGQEGRQFGHSLDISVNKNKKSLGENKEEILVVGGPSAKWTPRELDYGSPSGVGIGLMVFTDEFQPEFPKPTPQRPFYVQTYQEILDAILNKDLLFNYFGNPRVKFDVKIMICQPIADNPDIYSPPFPNKPSFITLNYISRNIGLANNPTKIEKIVNDMKASFFEAFPNSIPPILGLYVDDSSSLGRKSLEPSIDLFIDWYKKYSFDNGLRDSYGVRSSGVIIEYIPDIYDSENWIDMSKSILSEVLDTGNLIANDRVKFLTNTIGVFNTQIAEFNVPPESGGRVYIFEKESGSWNLIQEIKSPNITYQHPDRFGHAVSISDDGEVIAIGSPYITQAVMIYEKKPEQKDVYYSSLPSWVQNNYPNKYAVPLQKYEISQDVKELYLALDSYDKFKSRVDLDIQEYQPIHSFDYGNMQPIGSWSFIPAEVAPTSRLGYSVDVNENGSVVVASSPTDSFNQYNDGDVYYAYNGLYRGKSYNVGYIDPNSQLTGPINSSWSASTNAGSVHIFESRKYYPHNKVIEYGKFGNLHENLSNNTPDSGHFHYLADIFNDKNFEKTPFDGPGSTEIPREAGLIFIITPEIDALSDEIFNNISNWLALGDRNLVLVGNDPIWEQNGKYQKSNEILNKILERLESRMRIVPARNKYESLAAGYSTYNNIVPSFVPEGSTETYVSRLSVRGSGVADIKIYKPGYFDQMPCNEVTDCGFEPKKIQIQTKCEMPLMHYGDLRAQWNSLCCDVRGNTVIYGYNWPLAFGSYVPRCGDTEFVDKPTKNFEPIPLLVAAEQIDQELVSPAVPAVYKSFPIYETAYIGQTYYEYGDSENNPPAFAWDSGYKLYNSLKFNTTNNLNKELFYQPAENGILQAKALSRIDTTPYIEKDLVSEQSNFAVEYKFGDTSKVIVIAGIKSESQNVLYTGAGDRNVKFYTNLVSKSMFIQDSSNIAQIGGWTNRESFKSANPDSILYTLFRNNNNDVTENVQLLENQHDVAWIANADYNYQPNAQQINNIKQWLSSGNKKLIITYDNDFNSAKHVKYICSLLGINIEFVYLPYLDQYPKTYAGYLNINQNNQIGGKFFISKGKPRPNIIETFYSSFEFYPMKLDADSTSLAYFDDLIYDEIPRNIVNQKWDINAGIVELNVPVIPGSGYELFITTDADALSEILPLTIDVDNVSLSPVLPYPDNFYSLGIRELNENLEYFDSKNINTGFYTRAISSPSTISAKIQVGQNVDSINIYISSAMSNVANDISFKPKTIKLIGISGVLIPIYEKIATTSFSVMTDKFDIVKVSDAIPESREIINVTRPVSTDNTKYCSDKCQFLGGQLIEDGPVVAAQEIEILSSFDAGVARSRITVLSDSSMIQGKNIADQNGVIPNNTYAFIRSLYPETYFPALNYGRQFNVYHKLISPERGSPSKYYAQSSLSGINQNFGGIGSTSYSMINQNESKYLPQYVTRPQSPWEKEDTEEKIAEIKNFFISGFLDRQIQHASTAKFSGIIDGTTYIDANVAGGLPQLLKDKGYDYLDFDKMPSGYPGDLFGYSVCVRGTKVLVGSPFSAFKSEVITPWSGGLQLDLGYNGGAGSVYMFEKSGDAGWNCINKFRPQSLMGQLSGINQLSDQFGHSVSMQNDVIAIGAPNHDYITYYENVYESGSFARKNFNSELDIPKRNKYDLGLSGVRNTLGINGVNANDGGAIYVYENKITDWENKAQSWKLVEKVTSNSPNASGERFGRNVDLSRPYRTDADYTIVAGCNFASGDGLLNIGASYTKDIILKSQLPSFPNSGAWINAKVFGERYSDNNQTINLLFTNSGNNIPHYASGIVISNKNGDIFLEVSGQDPSTKGFIAHRPYIESVIGYYQYGTILTDSLPLFCDGKHISPSSNMPLFIDVENSAYVYNILGLYTDVISGTISNSGLNLFIEVPSGSSYESLNLFMPSGIGSLNDNLKLSIRGR